jgi:hypothetical protein
VALIAVTSPASALRDPREFELASASPGEVPVVRARENDLLMPYAAVFLPSLPDVRGALALPHGPGNEIVRALEHADEPVGAVHLAIPTRPWTVLRLEGPFDKGEALAAAAGRLEAFPHYSALDKWFAWVQPGLCEALRELNRACP